MKKSKLLINGTKSMIVLILLGAVLYNPLISRLRQHYMDGYIEYLEDNAGTANSGRLNKVEVPDSPLFKVEGENFDEEEAMVSEASIKSILSSDSNAAKEDPSLNLIGVLEIPSIDTKVPVWEGVSKKALRFGAGRYPLSSELGEDHGNCFLMGHRNRHLSTIFCRLQYVKEGASVIVKTKDSKVIEYKVSKTVAVPPDKVSDYMLDPDDGTSRLTLCTCITERGKGWRFIAVCTKSEF